VCRCAAAIITESGVGFNEENFHAFLTLDTETGKGHLISTRRRWF